MLINGTNWDEAETKDYHISHLSQIEVRQKNCDSGTNVSSVTSHQCITYLSEV